METSLSQFTYEPGNGSRYCLFYGRTDRNDCLLVWLKRGDVGGTAFRVMPHFGVIDQGYFMEKARIESEADAAALLGFLQDQGHEIHISSNHDERGFWRIDTCR